MKNIYTALAVLALAFGAGCTSDPNDMDTPANHLGEGLTLVGYIGADTRVSIGEKDGDRYPLAWSAGDALGIYAADGSTGIRNVMAVLNSSSDGEATGLFNSDPLEVTAYPQGIVVYYPYKEAGNVLTDDLKLRAAVPSTQRQEAPGASGHAPAAGLGYAAASVTASDTPVDFTMRYATAFVKFSVSSTELAGWNLTDVALYDRDNGTPLSGEITVDPATGTLDATAASTPYVKTVISSPQPLATAQEVYMATLPADFTGQDLYVVVALENGQGHTLTIPVLTPGGELRANALTHITLNDLSVSDNGVDWYEPLETRLLADGWAYGESNCVMTPGSPTGVDVTVNARARGDFMQVEEPRYVKVTWAGDLNTGLVKANGTSNDETALDAGYNFTVNAFNGSAAGNYAGGCGLVTIYGDGVDQYGERTPLWSFIVWVTDTPAEHTYGTTGYVVQDRNLGAPVTTWGDWKTNGVYFQWGRPIPFGWSATGYFSQPTTATDVRVSIENPRYLLYTAGVDNTKSDWYLGAWTGDRTDRKDDFWGNPNATDDPVNPSDGVKSIYDPCPKGYRVVSPGVLAEVQSAGEIEKGTGNGYGIKYRYNGSDYAWWPMNGCRWGSNAADRTTTNMTTSANYWSNSPAASVTNQSEHGATTMYYTDATETWTLSNGRSHAFAVRCMKDTDNR